MEKLSLVFSIYLLFVAPVVIGGVVVWLLASNRIRLRIADWLLLLLPFAIWLGAIFIQGGNKSLSNIAEAFYAGCVTVLFFATRSLLTVAKPLSEGRWSAYALAGSCLAALALWALVPSLPE